MQLIFSEDYSSTKKLVGRSLPAFISLVHSHSPKCNGRGLSVGAQAKVLGMLWIPESEGFYVNTNWTREHQSDTWFCTQPAAIQK